jgi:hypothetical protein
MHCVYLRPARCKLIREVSGRVRPPAFLASVGALALDALGWPYLTQPDTDTLGRGMEAVPQAEKERFKGIL